MQVGSVEKSSGPPRGLPPNYETRAVFFIAIITGFRLAYCRLTNLGDDEVYYWDWSRRLDFGYYEGYPAIAWVIRLTTSILGQSEFGVRVAAPVLFALTSLLLFRLAMLMFSSARVGLWTVVLFNLAPGVFFLGWIMYPDALLLFAWVLSMYALWRAANEGAMRWWLLLGFGVGLGFLSKYSMAMFVPCAGLFLLVSPSHRRWLLLPQPYAALLFAAALVSPNLIWNAHHDWIAFRFLAAHRDRAFVGPSDVPTFWLEQALMNSPLVLLGCIAALFCVVLVRGYWRRPAIRMLFSVSAPVLAFFILDSFSHCIFMNWPLPGYLGAYVVLASVLCSWTEVDRPAEVRVVGMTSASVGLIGELMLCFLVLFPFAPRAIGLPLVGQAVFETDKYLGWDALGRNVDMMRDSMDGHGDPFVASDHWAITGYLSFYCRGRPRSYCLFGWRGSQYDIWDDRRQLTGRDAVFVMKDVSASDCMPLLEANFERVGSVRVLSQTRPEFPTHVVRTLLVVPCYGFRPTSDPDAVPLLRYPGHRLP